MGAFERQMWVWFHPLWHSLGIVPGCLELISRRKSSSRMVPCYYLHCLSVHPCQNRPDPRSARGPLSRTISRKRTVPVVVSNNIRSIFGKMPCLDSWTHSNACEVCIQGSWLSRNIGDGLARVCQNVVQCKKTDDVATYINSEGSGKSNIVFIFCRDGKCLLRLSSYRGTITGNARI